MERYMVLKKYGITAWTVLGLLTGAVLTGVVLVGGCAQDKGQARLLEAPPAQPASTGSDAAASTNGQGGGDAKPQAAGQPAADQGLFDSADDAVKEMLAAVKSHDHERLHQIFGPEGKELVTGDRVEDRNAREDFAKKAAEQTRIEKTNDKMAILHVGKEDWPFPIPLVRTAEGKWFFDTAAGKDEILARLIGDDELEAIDVCYAYVEAQRQYAGQDRDGSGLRQYAQHLMSTDDKKDGLYWVAKPGEGQSPFGPLVAQARAEGYGQAKGPEPKPYHGYYFRILRSQGPDAPGGKYDYVINGHMIAGFALLAYPDKYGSSGIMTFEVSHQGVVYQKDLGPQTGKVAATIEEYNPG